MHFVYICKHLDPCKHMSRFSSSRFVPCWKCRTQHYRTCLVRLSYRSSQQIEGCPAALDQVQNHSSRSRPLQSQVTHSRYTECWHQNQDDYSQFLTPRAPVEQASMKPEPCPICQYLPQRWSFDEYSVFANPPKSKSGPSSKLARGGTACSILPCLAEGFFIVSFPRTAVRPP